MLTHLLKLSFCAIVAVIAGAVAAAATQAASSPGIWARPVSLWYLAVGAALFYAAVPVALLVAISMFRPIPSALGCALVAVGWLTLIFAWWVYKPWLYSGEFPWWGFKRHYLGLMPVPLSIGLAFTLCGRAAIGPNHRLERP